jgi:hypothetical protein
MGWGFNSKQVILNLFQHLTCYIIQLDGNLSCEIPK